MADIAGIYSVNETCNVGAFGYTIEIELDTTAQQTVRIFNLADLGASVNATVAGSSFIIPRQVLFNDTLQGAGEVNEGTLSIDYELIPDSGQTLVCTLVGSLQP